MKKQTKNILILAAIMFLMINITDEVKASEPVYETSSRTKLHFTQETDNYEILSQMGSIGTFSNYAHPTMNSISLEHDLTRISISNLQKYSNQDTVFKTFNDTTEFTEVNNSISEFTTSAPFDTIFTANMNYSADADPGSYDSYTVNHGFESGDLDITGSDITAFATSYSLPTGASINSGGLSDLQAIDGIEISIGTDPADSRAKCTFYFDLDYNNEGQTYPIQIDIVSGQPEFSYQKYYFTAYDNDGRNLGTYKFNDADLTSFTLTGNGIASIYTYLWGTGSSFRIDYLKVSEPDSTSYIKSEFDYTSADSIELINNTIPANIELTLSDNVDALEINGDEFTDQIGTHNYSIEIEKGATITVELSHTSIFTISVEIFLFPNLLQIEDIAANITYEIDAIEYNRNITMVLVSSSGNFEHGNITYRFDASQIPDYDHISDITYITQDIIYYLNFTGITDMNWTVQTSYSSNEWQVPSEINLKLNTYDIGDESYNSGFIGFNSYPTSLVFTADTDLLLFNFTIESQFSHNLDLDIISTTYFRKTPVLSSYHDLDLIQCDFLFDAAIKHSYINNIDFGNASTIYPLVEVAKSSSLKIEVILSDEAYLPLELTVLADTESLLSIISRSNTLSYSSQIGTQSIFVEMPDNHKINAISLAVSNIQYIEAYTHETNNYFNEYYEMNPIHDPNVLFDGTDLLDYTHTENNYYNSHFESNPTYTSTSLFGGTELMGYTHFADSYFSQYYESNPLIQSSSNFTHSYSTNYSYFDNDDSQNLTNTNTNNLGFMEYPELFSTDLDYAYETLDIVDADIELYNSTDSYLLDANVNHLFGDRDYFGEKSTFDENPKIDLYGHNDILEIEEDETQTFTFDAQTDGTIEVWVLVKTSLTILDVSLGDSTDQPYGFRIFSNYFQFKDDIGNSESVNIDEWVHIQFEFNCTTDISKAWIDGVYYDEFFMSSSISTVDRISFAIPDFGGVYGESYAYVDAIDYSWADDYYMNRNLEYSDNSYLISQGGHYKGAESFDFNAPNTSPSSFSIPSRSETYVLDEFEGHQKVLSFEAHETWSNLVYEFPTQTSGSMEFWEYIESGKTSGVYIGNGNSFIFYFDITGNIWYYLDSVWTDSEYSFNYDKWMHILIEFEADSLDLTIDNIPVATFDMYTQGQTIDRIQFQSSSATTHKFYIDALDYSWADSYYINRNQEINTSVDLDSWEANPTWESGHYQAEYSFNSDILGSQPYYLEYYETYSDIKVNDTLDDHNQILELEHLYSEDYNIHPGIETQNLNVINENELVSDISEFYISGQGGATLEDIDGHTNSCYIEFNDPAFTYNQLTNYNMNYSDTIEFNFYLSDYASIYLGTWGISLWANSIYFKNGTVGGTKGISLANNAWNHIQIQFQNETRNASIDLNHGGDVFENITYISSDIAMIRFKLTTNPSFMYIDGLGYASNGYELGSNQIPVGTVGDYKTADYIKGKNEAYNANFNCLSTNFLSSHYGHKNVTEFYSESNYKYWTRTYTQDNVQVDYWFKPNTTDKQVYHNIYNAGTELLLIYFENNGQLATRINGDWNPLGAYEAKWYHIHIELNRNALSFIIIDNELVHSYVAADLATSHDKFQLTDGGGAFYMDGLGYDFDGYAPFSNYHPVGSAAQIENTYTSTSGSMEWWQYNQQNSSSIIIDSSTTSQSIFEFNSTCISYHYLNETYIVKASPIFDDWVHYMILWDSDEIWLYENSVLISSALIKSVDALYSLFTFNAYNESKFLVDAIDFSNCEGYFENRNTLDNSTAYPEYEEGHYGIENPDFWDENIEGTCSINYVEFDGHENVLEIIDTDSIYLASATSALPSLVSGSIEYEVALTAHTYTIDRFYIKLASDSTTALTLVLYGGYIHYYPNGADTSTGIAYSATELTHIRFVFDCESGTKGQMTLYINGELFASDFEMQNDVDYINSIVIYSRGESETDYKCYFDALDYSGYSGYYVNRNTYINKTAVLVYVPLVPTLSEGSYAFRYILTTSEGIEYYSDLFEFTITEDFSVCPNLEVLAFHQTNVGETATISITVLQSLYEIDQIYVYDSISTNNISIGTIPDNYTVEIDSSTYQVYDIEIMVIDVAGSWSKWSIYNLTFAKKQTTVDIENLRDVYYQLETMELDFKLYQASGEIIGQTIEGKTFYPSGSECHDFSDSSEYWGVDLDIDDSEVGYYTINITYPGSTQYLGYSIETYFEVIPPILPLLSVSYDTVNFVSDTNYNEELTPDIFGMGVLPNRENGNVFDIAVSSTSFAISTVKVMDSIVGSYMTLSGTVGYYCYGITSSTSKIYDVDIEITDVKGLVRSISITNLFFAKNQTTVDIENLKDVYYQTQDVSLSTQLYQEDGEISEDILLKLYNSTDDLMDSETNTLDYSLTLEDYEYFTINATFAGTNQYLGYSIETVFEVLPPTLPQIDLYYDSNTPVGNSNTFEITVISQLNAISSVNIYDSISEEWTQLGTSAGSYDYEITSSISQTYYVNISVIESQELYNNVSITELFFEKNATCFSSMLFNQFYQNTAINLSTSVRQVSTEGIITTEFDSFILDPDDEAFLEDDLEFFIAYMSTGYYTVNYTYSGNEQFLNCSIETVFEILPAFIDVLDTQDVSLTLNSTDFEGNVLLLDGFDTDALEFVFDSNSFTTFDLEINFTLNYTQALIFTPNSISNFTFDSNEYISSIYILNATLEDYPNFKNYYFDGAISSNYAIENGLFIINESINETYYNYDKFELMFEVFGDETFFQVDSAISTQDEFVLFREFAKANRTFQNWYASSEYDVISNEITHIRTGTSESLSNDNSNYYFTESETILNDTFQLDWYLDPNWEITHEIIENNGTYIKIKVALQCDLDLENVSIFFTPEIYYSTWSNATQNSNYQVEFFTSRIVSGTNEFYLEASRDIPAADYFGYGSGVNLFLYPNMDSQIPYFATIEYPEYSEVWSIPIQSEWTLDGVHYMDQPYTIENGVYFCEGFDSSITSSFLYFTTNPLNSFDVIMGESTITLKINLDLPLNQTLIMFPAEIDGNFRITTKGVSELYDLDGQTWFLFDDEMDLEPGLTTIKITYEKYSLANSWYYAIPLMIIMGVGIIYYLKSKAKPAKKPKMTYWDKMKQTFGGKK